MAALWSILIVVSLALACVALDAVGLQMSLGSAKPAVAGASDVHGCMQSAVAAVS